MPYHKYIIEIRRRKRGGESNSLSESGLETKRTNWRNMAHLIPESLKARLSYFPVKLVIIPNEFAIVIEVTRLSCDGLVVVTNEFALFIEATRLSCDGLVIIAQPDCTFRLPSQFSSTPLYPHLFSYYS